MNMKYFTIVLMLAFGASVAQTDSVISELRASVSAFNDVETVIEIYQQGLKDVTIVEAYALPPDLARYVFVAPDSLDGQIIIEEGATSMTYLPLAHQVIVEEGVESDLGGGLFAALDVSNFDNFLPDDEFTFELGDSYEQDGDTVQVFFAVPKQPSSEIVRFELHYFVTQGRPVKVIGYDHQSKELASARFTSWETNTGLKDDQVKALPDDAEVLR